MPLTVAGSGVEPDGTAAFGERTALDGAIGTIRGIDILPRLVRLLD